MSNRLRSFTILEVVVGMLITALVISITYTAFQIVSGAYESYRKKNSGMNDILLLDELLEKDFRKAERITGTPQQILLTDSGKTTIIYHFQQNYILREGLRRDTFKLSPNNVRLLFEGSDIEDDLADELIFKALYQQQTISYHYKKLYSSEILSGKGKDAQH